MQTLTTTRIAEFTDALAASPQMALDCEQLPIEVMTTAGLSAEEMDLVLYGSIAEVRAAIDPTPRAYRIKRRSPWGIETTEVSEPRPFIIRRKPIPGAM